MIAPFHLGRGARFSACVCAALLAVAGCSKPQARPQRPPVTVAVVTARRTDVPYNVDANGIVTPLQTAAVTPQVDGIITDVMFNEGQEVSRGQVLFRIDARPYQAAFDQAQAMLARDKATYENAKKEADRYDQLARTGVVSTEEAEQLRTTASATQATVQADSALVATARFNLENTTIRAPISGRTGSLLIRAGNVVHAAGGTPLVVINQVRPTLVRFAVPASELPLILQYGGKGGLPVTAVPGASAAASAAADTVAAAAGVVAESTPLTDAARAGRGSGAGDGDTKGTLSFIDNAVDTTTGTILLKATFPNKSGTMWAGQWVATSLRLFVEQSALVIPAQAVVTGQKGAYVYVIDSSGTAQQRAVAVERNASGLAVIAAGVQDGDRVVTDGQARLTPGATVDVRSPNDTGGPPAGRGRGRGGGGGGKGRRGGGG